MTFGGGKTRDLGKQFGIGAAREREGASRHAAL
jgi:hypothetical protein